MLLFLAQGGTLRGIRRASLEQWQQLRQRSPSPASRRMPPELPIAVLEVATPRRNIDWAKLIAGVRDARAPRSSAAAFPSCRRLSATHCASPRLFPCRASPQLSKALESCNLGTGLLPSVTASVPMEYSALSQAMSARLSNLINVGCTKYNAALGQAWQTALSDAPFKGPRTIMLQTWGLPSCVVAQEGIDSLRTFRAMCCSTPLLLGQGLPGQSLQKGPVDWTGGGAMFRNSTYPLHHFAHAAGLHSGCAIRMVGHEHSTNERIIFVLEFLFRQTGTSAEAIAGMHAHFRALLKEVATLGVEASFEVDTKQRDPRALNASLFLEEAGPQLKLEEAKPALLPQQQLQQQLLRQQEYSQPPLPHGREREAAAERAGATSPCSPILARSLVALSVHLRWLPAWHSSHSIPSHPI